MSWLKLLVTALVAVLAVVGGLVAAAVIAAIGLIAFIARRWFTFFGGNSRASPNRSSASRSRAQPRERPADAIEITATEVPAEDSRR